MRVYKDNITGLYYIGNIIYPGGKYELQFNIERQLVGIGGDKQILPLIDVKLLKKADNTNYTSISDFISEFGDFFYSRLSLNEIIELEQRILNIIYEYELYEIIESTSGTLSIPQGSEIYLGAFAQGVDCLIVQVDENQKPIDESVFDPLGDIVTSTLNVNGNFELSSTPTQFPVALVYRVLVKLKDVPNIPIEFVLGSWDFNNTDRVENLSNLPGTTLTEVLNNLEESGVNGSVFITNVVPQSTGNVGNKVFSSNGRVLDSCVTDTSNVRVSVLALTGNKNYRPVITINDVVVPLTDPNTSIPLFTGNLNITLPVDMLVELTAKHEDGAKHTITISQEVPPIIEELRFTGSYPGTQTELKAGDTFQIFVKANEPIDRIEVDDFEACVSSVTNVGSGTTHTFVATIANRGVTSQNLGARVRVRKPSGSWSSYVLTENIVVLNNLYPSIDINSITYPNSQQALKNNEVATVNHTITNHTTVVYSSPNGGELSISNTSTYEPAKTVQRVGGVYNINTNNFRVVANRSQNNATTTVNTIVNIANIAATITMTEPASRLRTGGNDGTSIQSYTITLTSSQNLLSTPTIADPSAGGGNWSGNFVGGPTVYTRTLQCHDSNDTVGAYSYGALSATNLAGIETTAYTGDATYIIGGFVSRTLTLLAFQNEVSFGAAVVDYSKCTLTWSFKSLPNRRAFNTTTTPDANSWCMAGTLNSQPTIARILDTAATSGSSDDTTVTIAEEI